MPQMGKTWSTLNGQPLHDYLEEGEIDALLKIAEEIDKWGDGDCVAEYTRIAGMKESICIYLDARGVLGVGDTLRRTWKLP